MFYCSAGYQCNEATLKEHHNCFNLICIFINSTKKIHEDEASCCSQSLTAPVLLNIRIWRNHQSAAENSSNIGFRHRQYGAESSDNILLKLV